MTEDLPSRLPGMAGPALALAAMGYAHLASAEAVNPLSSLVSEYALRDDTTWAMAVGTFALAVGCLWVAYLLAKVNPVRGAAARALFVAAALGLLLTAAFPTDAAPDVVSFGGEIHRWSAAVVFTALPCAAWMLGRRSGNPALAGAGVVSVTLLAWFLAAHPGSLISEMIGGSGHYGLAQRLLLVAEMALIFLAAAEVGRRGDGTAAPRPYGGGRGVSVPLQPGPPAILAGDEPLPLNRS